MIEVIANVAALRAATATTLYVGTVRTIGYYTATLNGTPDAGANTYYYDASDTTSVDDGGSCILDSTSPTPRRWKAIFQGPILVDQFGAKSDYNVGAGTGTDNYSSIVAANTYASTHSRSLEFLGIYLMKPVSTIPVTIPWIGSDPTTSQIYVDPTGFTGPYISVQSTVTLNNLQVRQKGATPLAGGVGVYFVAPTNTNFLSMTGLRRCWIIGFDKNISCDNSFQLIFDSVRSEAGNEGFYCIPTAGGGAGFINGHTHINCYYNNNARNMYYAPTVNSQTVTLIGTTIQNATGSSQNCNFTNCLTVSITGCYFENGPSVPGILLNSVYCEMKSCFLNGTGGIVIGTGNANIVLHSIIANTSTDTLNVNNSTNARVRLENCKFPASGNTLVSSALEVIASSIQGLDSNTSFYQHELNFDGSFKCAHQSTTIAVAAATTVFRFLDIYNNLETKSIAGTFNAFATDSTSSANQATYVYAFASPRNSGTAGLSQLVTSSKGTNPGASSTPFSTAADGTSSLIQFTKSTNVTTVRVECQFVGLCIT